MADDVDSAALKASVGPLWDALVEHPFPAAMAAATLPPQAFSTYVAQNLLYLPEYARALALGAASSREEYHLQRFARAVTNIVEVEIPQNRALLAAVLELAGPAEHPTTAGPATVAYASWLLAVAARGEVALTYAAILPCAWSYGDIGRHLAPGLRPHPVYADWIGFFAADEYDAVVADLRAATDRALATASSAVAHEAGEVFRTGCRLERQFWDAALTGLTWPDLAEA